eukprot:5624874-Alexandrium_andersonii.AAC.1
MARGEGRLARRLRKLGAQANRGEQRARALCADQVRRLTVQAERCKLGIQRTVRAAPENPHPAPVGAGSFVTALPRNQPG